MTVAHTTDMPARDIEFPVVTIRDRLGEWGKPEVGPSVEILDVPHRETEWGIQYKAEELLERAKGLREEHCHLVMLLTSEDIFAKGTNFVFGLATWGAGVISSRRINPSFWEGVISNELQRASSDTKDFIERQYAKVLIHELGHAMGLGHCPRLDCAMHYSNSPIDLYRKGEKYCQKCESEFLTALRALCIRR